LVYRDAEPPDEGGDDEGGFGSMSALGALVEEETYPSVWGTADPAQAPSYGEEGGY
jgi:hypothetical protein